MSTNLELTSQEVWNCCQSYLLLNTEENLRVINYELTSIGGTPTGFLGCHRLLNVLIERHYSNECVEYKLKFFFKSVPNDVPSQLEYLEKFGVFEKEVAVYEQIIPQLENINVVCAPNFTPKCFLTAKNYLILENLADQGFHLAAKHDGVLSYDHLVCALNTLASMHAASLVLESQVGKNINEIFPKLLDENAYPSDPKAVRSIHVNKTLNALCELLKIIPKYQNSSQLDFIVKEFRKKIQLIFQLSKTSTKYRNTFLHGDLWANNIMFRYDENKPVECRLIDFQLARYAPPILDVVTVLTIPTTSEFRKGNLEHLIEHYWKTLKMNMQKHNLSLENFITKSEYNESVFEYKIAGLIESCLFSHMTLLPEELVSNLLKNSNDFENFINNKRSELCVKAFQSNKMYRERLTDMITDIVDNYIFLK